jgi:putative phosphoribosyl transferase
MVTETRFRNRTEAGRLLARKLTQYANRPDAIVLGLPRGGVPVAFEVATALNVPLDICLVRKLGVPGHQELAMGAIAFGGVQVLDRDVLAWLRITEQTIGKVAAQELQELQRRDRVYRGDRAQPQLCDRVVILVDDGLATGSTMRAAIEVVKTQQPQRIVVAIPVAPPETYQKLRTEVDEVVCLMTPPSFYAIGMWYEDFAQTTDAQVCELLRKIQGPQIT